MTGLAVLVGCIVLLMVAITVFVDVAYLSSPTVKHSSRTTNSYHSFQKYRNIIKNLKIDRPKQIWTSDIAFVRTVKKFCDLTLITGKYSRKIVGLRPSNGLELKGYARALNIAISYSKSIKKFIHSSVRGLEYCSYVYPRILKRKKIEISLNIENRWQESAMAERATEFYLRN